jgi:integral membrane sensor domain MASE1
MPDGRHLGNWKRYIAKVAGIAAVYYGAAKLGLSLAFATTSVTAVWPPTGIALAAVALWGYRVWPGVALGAFLANTWTGVPIYTVLGITVGNTLEALAGVYLLLKFADFRTSLERVRDVVALVVLGGVTSTMISASIGVTSLLAGNEIAAGDFGSVWRTWWLGDMGGDLVVAPALLVAAAHWPFTGAPGRQLEAVAVAVVVAAVSALVFSGSTGFAYLVFPPLIWATLRFLQPGAVGATLLVAGIAIPLTENDLGPFSGHPPDDRLLLAQTFIGMASVTSLVLAAAITERKRAEEQRTRVARRLHDGLAQDLAFISMEGDRLAERDPGAAAMAAAAREALVASRGAIFELRDPDGPLPAALARLATVLAGRHGIRLRLDIDQHADASPETRMGLLEITREAISNAVCHGDASEIWIRLDGERGIRLSILDDGKGFDPALVAAGESGDVGFGLTGMKETAADLGGAMHLRAHPGGGTEVDIVIP